MSEKVPYKKALEMLYEKNAEINNLRTRFEEAEKEKERMCDECELFPALRRDKKYLMGEGNKLRAENTALKELLREIYNSIPATHDENDSMVKRHARALNEIKKILDGGEG